jgi:hypothetical protein
MEIPSETSQQQQLSASSSSLAVAFQWKSFKGLISHKNDPESKTLYEISFGLTKPHLVYKRAVDNKIIGTARLHLISINAECEVNGRSLKLEAQKRLQTHYRFLSHVLSDTNEAMALTWTATCGLKEWVFTCLDQNQLPVARFVVNIWAVRKAGTLEFQDPKTESDQARKDEIVVTAYTVFYVMLCRTNNICQLFGALFLRPGQQADVPPPAKRVDDADEISVEPLGKYGLE